MGGRAIDLFDDPPWPAEEPATERRVHSSRPALAASLALAITFVASMALPWFGSGEIYPLTPFSHHLDLGWAPGTQKWGFLVLALAVALAFAIELTLLRPGRALRGTLVVLATALVVAVSLETTAHLSVNPGPDLTAGDGAWIGDALAVFTWLGIAVATCFAVADRHEAQRR